MKENLYHYLNEIDANVYVLKILYWEMNTNSPKEEKNNILNIISKYESKVFEMQNNKKYYKLINDYILSDEFKNIFPYEKEYILSLRDNYKKISKIPLDFYNNYSNLKNKTLNLWVEAKNKNNYKIVEKSLIELIESTKKFYNYMYPNNKNIYDCMLNEYEKGIKTDLIDKLFEALKKELIPIIKKSKSKNVKIEKNKYSNSQLFDISQFLLKYIGFNNNRGSLGIYTHGYTTKISNNDVRIAFNNEVDLIEHFLTIIHEGGHGIFEQNISSELKKLPFYEIDKFALHESQSRFYENILARNINFWIPIYNKLNKKYNFNFSLDDLEKNLKFVKPSLIRTQADELTYPIHIIIRYEIEKDIFNNNIDLKELPKIWNKKYKDYLNINAKNDNEGILQDMHWFDGSFGYFPCYLLGTIFDGMLLKYINKELGNINELLKNGNILQITNFLNNKIHKYGSYYNINEISNKLLGNDLEINSIINYFKNKYN